MQSGSRMCLLALAAVLAVQPTVSRAQSQDGPMEASEKATLGLWGVDTSNPSRTVRPGMVLLSCRPHRSI